MPDINRRKMMTTNTIMTVDDSPSMRQMVGFTLKGAGYDVVEAGNGKEALEKMNQHSVVLLLVDLNMPVMNGIELIRNIRQGNVNQFVPIIMLTTESQDAKKREGKEAGATGWIIKPFQPNELLAVVRKVVGK
jgi:two-component system chemotaxis response regulator CheY